MPWFRIHFINESQAIRRFWLYRHFIVFVWSQYDGAKIEQITIGYGWRQNQGAKLKIVGGDLSGYNQQDLDPTIHYLTSVVVP